MPENQEIPIGPIELIVFQSTPFCNLDCSYCYLADRGNTSKLRLDHFERIMRTLVESGRMSEAPLLLWHAGEPLTVPLSFYRDASRSLRTILPAEMALTQTIQTNGTLLDSEWCQFFQEERYYIGLSLDGPEFIHDAKRKTRRGTGTYHQVMRGLELLQKHDVAFSVICVLSGESLDYPDELYDFFVEHGVQKIGFNIEESEGINASSTYAIPDLIERYRSFMARLFERHLDGRLKIREFDNVKDNLDVIQRRLNSQRVRKNTSLNRPLSILTISHTGDAATFSPELLGQTSNRYGQFVMGNLLTQSVDDLLVSKVFQESHRDLREGLRKCRETCEYFVLCGGGAPSNKLSENGTLASTETQYCRTHIQPVIDLVLAALEEQVAMIP